MGFKANQIGTWQSTVGILKCNQLKEKHRLQQDARSELLRGQIHEQKLTSQRGHQMKTKRQGSLFSCEKNAW
jgi:hypothetical protein